MTTWTVGLVDFSAKLEVQSNGRCVTRYKRKYLVRTDSSFFETEGTVAAAVGINRGSPIDTDLNAICHSGEVTPGPVMTRPPHLAYYATYEFSTDAVLPADNDDDPTTTRTIWSISPEIQSTYIIKDRAGDLIVNSAGSPYDGGVPVDVRRGTATATRNKDAAGYDKDAVLANSGKVNSVAFLGGDPGTVQVDISAQERYEGGFHFWAETYKFAYNPEGWQPAPVDAGFFQRESAGSSVLLRIINSDLGDTVDPDSPVQEPEPLDEDGILVPPGSAHRPSECGFIDVDFYPTMDFNDFGL